MSPTDWTKYDELQGRSPNTIELSHTSKGYVLLGPAEEPVTGAPPALTSKDIHEGYALLGSPAQEAAVKTTCPLRPDSTYAEVRQEGESVVPVRNATPSQAAFDDYSRLGFPTANEEESVPEQEAAAKPVCLQHPDSTYSEVRHEGGSFVPVRNGTPSQEAFDDYSRLGFPTTSAEDGEPMPMSGIQTRGCSGMIQLKTSHFNLQNVEKQIVLLQESTDQFLSFE